MTIVKAFFLMLLPVWLLMTSPVSYSADNAAILIDADTGRVLYEQQAHRSWYPASLTKVMTLYMTFEALRSGRIGLYDDLRVSGHASMQPTSKLGLHSGEYITVENAILALITRSANDAAVVLAEHLGVTEENFAIKMTAKAHTLGMYNTHFMNATGLPNDWQVTTARDMAVMAFQIRRNFPEYYQYFSAHSMFFRDRELRAINKFTANYPGAEGMKTGFTCGSGYNLIGAASQAGKHLIGVILGGMTSNERYALMMDMMDEGFADQLEARGNVMSTVATLTGEPPHQLGCGHQHHHETIVAQNDDQEEPVFVNRTRYKRLTPHLEIPRPATAKPEPSRVVRVAPPVREAKPHRPIEIARARPDAHHHEDTHSSHSSHTVKYTREVVRAAPAKGRAARPEPKAAKAAPIKLAKVTAKPAKAAAPAKAAGKPKAEVKAKTMKVEAKTGKKSKRG